MSDTCIFMFGRMNPVHKGHGMVFEKALQMQQSIGSDLKFFLSKSTDKIKNPLPIKLKRYYIEGFYPEIGSTVQDCGTNLFEIMHTLDGKYKDVLFICGSDRKDEFQKTLEKYNGTLYNFDSITTVQAGYDRTGCIYSSTMMRAAALEQDFERFSTALPGTDDMLKMKMFQDVMRHMRN